MKIPYNRTRLRFWFRVWKYGWRYYTDDNYRRNIARKIKLNTKYGKGTWSKYVNRKRNFRNSHIKGSYGKCANCLIYKVKKELTVDHIIPISKGGNLSKDNMQILCKNCHHEKTIQETCQNTNSKTNQK